MAGDIVAFFLGFETPFVLRRYDDAYRLVDARYIHGAMDGSLCESLKEQYVEEDVFPTLTFL